MALGRAEFVLVPSMIQLPSPRGISCPQSGGEEHPGCQCWLCALPMAWESHLSLLGLVSQDGPGDLLGQSHAGHCPGLR